MLWLLAVLSFGALMLHSGILASGDGAVSRTPRAYYHYATEALLDGRWHLSIEPRPELAELPNAYDPAQNIPYRMLDLTYYQGRYYFYWGMAPAVVVFAPVRLLTGLYLSEALASALLGTVAFAAMAAVLLGLRRQHAPAAGPVLTALALLLLGCGSWLLLLAAGDSVYGVPITAAAAGQAAAWWCIYRALLSERHRAVVAWTVGAGLALAISLTSRPNTVLWVAVYGLPLWILCRRPGVRRGQLLLAAAVPPALGVALMLWANWARFGSITEFGMRYQLTGPVQPEVLFSLQDLVRNLGVYAWNFPRVSRYFPFFTTPATAPFGVFTTLPAVYLVLGLWWWRRERVAGTVGATVLLAGVGGLLATCAFFGCGTRYMVDFLPAWMLAAALGGLALAQHASATGRRWLAWVPLLLLAVSNATALALHAQTWDLLGRDLTPVARVLNAPTFAWERLVSPPRGPLSITFQPPTGKPGAFEPLLSVGSPEDGGEIVFLTYGSDQDVRVGFFQTGTTHWLSAPLPLDHNRPHELFVSLGSLMPPASHPLFRSWTADARRASQREVVIGLDGELIYRTELDFRAGRKVSAVVGENAVLVGVSEERFTGQIHAVQWHPVEPDVVARVLPAVQSEAAFGRWRLRVIFPADPANTVMDPLLVSGAPGAGDFIYAFYPQPGRVAFGHDAWGHGGSSSASLPIEPGVEYTIEISHGGLYWPRHAAEWAEWPPAARDELKGLLRIWLNGELVAEFREHVHDAAPASVTPFENRIGGSTTSARFSGQAVAAERLPAGAPPP